MFVFETGQLTNPRYIINFPTKRHRRGKSRIEDIESGLQTLVNTIRQYNIRSIAIPPLGSGLGGLDWSIVKSRIETMLQSLTDVHIIIYEPNGVTEKATYTRDVPAMTPGRYAENLRHVLNAIEGHFVCGYADGGDKPDKQLQLVPGAIDDAARFLEQHPDTRERFNKVAELVEGFESPFGLELLSTVHWVMTQDNVLSLEDVIRCTYDWNDRKRQFTSRQIAFAIDVLSDKGWVRKFEGQKSGY